VQFHVALIEARAHLVVRDRRTLEQLQTERATDVATTVGSDLVVALDVTTRGKQRNEEPGHSKTKQLFHGSPPNPEQTTRLSRGRVRTATFPAVALGLWLSVPGAPRAVQRRGSFFERRSMLALSAGSN
jgi:hypothetical protein